MKPIFLSGAALGALALFLLPTAVQAQATTPAPGDAADGATGAGASKASPAEKDDIVVTARRREEKLDQVPAAVTVMTGEQGQDRGIDAVDELIRQVPGASLVSSGPSFLDDISIRGQGSGRLGFSESAVGIYRDGLFSAGGGFGGRTLTPMDFFDVSRIEVLRGPQGALYGRNSVGGAINVILNQASEKPGVSGTIRYLDPEEIAAQAVLNLPLTDTLALRVGGLFDDEKKGFIRNLDTGDYLDLQSSRGARASLSFRPTSRISLDARYEYYDGDQPSYTSVAYRPTRADGATLPNGTVITPTSLDPSPYERLSLNHEGRANIRDSKVQVNGHFDLGWGKLVAQFLHDDRKGARSDEDGDHFDGGTGIDVAPGTAVLFQDYVGGQAEDYRHTGASLYLQSADNAPISWLVGGEFLTSTSVVSTGPSDCPAYTGTVQPLVPGCIVGAAGTFTPAATAASIISNNVRATGQLAMRKDDFAQDLRSFAVFASAEVPITPRIRLGAELRYQHDYSTFDFQRYSQDPLVYFGTGPVPAGMMAPIMVDPDGPGPLPSAPAEFCPPTLAPSQCAPGYETVRINAKRETGFFTPTATLHWNFLPGQNAYLRFATGYRPGGFNTNLLSGATRDALNAYLLYKPEHTYSYEIGWKGSLFGGALKGELALYYQRTTDIQVATAAAPAARGFLLVNAGDAHVYGVEGSLSHSRRIGPGKLDVSVNFSSEGGEYESGTVVPISGTSQDVSGNAVPRLRHLQLAFNASYSLPVTSSLQAFVSGGVQHAEGGNQDPFATKAYPGYTLIDARVGLRAKNWSLSVFGHNLGDERYELSEIAATQYWSSGRSVGVEFSIRQ